MELTLQGLSFLDIKTNKIQYQPWSRITQIIDYRGWVTRGRYGPLVPYREMRIFCGKQFYVIPEAYFPVSMDEIIQNLREFDPNLAIHIGGKSKHQARIDLLKTAGFLLIGMLIFIFIMGFLSRAASR